MLGGILPLIGLESRFGNRLDVPLGSPLGLALGLVQIRKSA